jgi:hypothetical protein
MRNTWRNRRLRWMVSAAIVLVAPVSRAQNDSPDKKGIDSGNYNIQQSIEAGYRVDWINGNINTYNTFVNLGQGVRLLDYSLDMHSLDHNGLVFDTLNFYNFGYGGDPDNVTRLRVQKNNWYDFTYLIRRDKNFWDWSLLANPLNSPITAPASPPVFPTNPNPNTVLITASPHSLDLVRRMQDFDLTIRPESKLRFRLGYSRNVDEGPALTSLDGGTETILNQNYRVTTNTYHLGVDIRYLPKTTISYDQFFKDFKQDTFTFDAVGATTPFTPLFPPGFNQFQLANGSPVDLGAVWTSSAPCSTPVIAGTVPPTVTSTCNGFFNGPLTLPANNGFPAVTGTLAGYSLFARPRNFMPTEHISFQSNYFTNLQMSGSFAYSTADLTVNDLLETQDFWSPKSLERGSQTAGPAKAKQYSATADFMVVYSIDGKTRIRDVFRFDNWRIPSMWTSFSEAFVAGAVGAGGPAGMLAPISTLFFADPAAFGTTCTAAGSFNQIGCPQHDDGSDPDFTNQFWQRTLSEDTKSNTIQLEHDFNKRLSARVGFLYTNRKIGDFNAVTDILKVYVPGGAGGNAANAFLAARGDCEFDNGVLPANCTLNAATGVVTEVGPEAGNDTSVNITNIHEYSVLLGVTARPFEKFRINGDFQFGSNDNAFVRPDARNLQVYKIHATYRPNTWASVDGTIDIHENRDNVFTVNDLEHDRHYSFSTTLSPNSKLAIDFGYTYFDFFTNIAICYASGVAGQPTTLCPIVNPGDSTLGATSRYSSTDHFVFGDMMWKPYKRVTVTLGFGGNFTRGYSNFLNQPQFGSSAGGPAPELAPVILNANTPSGTLNFNYLRPYGSIAVDIYKGLSYKAAWNYYGFNEKGPPDPATLSAIGARDFNGNTATFSLRYSF